MRLTPCFLIFMLLLAGCQPILEAEPTASPATATTPAVSVKPDNEFIVWGQGVLTESIDFYMEELFEERHPDIDVVFVDAGWDEALRQNLENSLQMGRPPEIVIGENYFRSFAATGDIQAVDSILEQYDDLIPATYAGAIYDDQVYAVPFLTGVFAFERNCAVIDAAGLDCDNPPVYWDELLEETTQISQQGLGDYFGYTLQGPGGTAVGSAFRIAVYQAQLGALPCANDACTIPDFNRSETIAVYEYLRELVQQTPPDLIKNANEGEVYEALFRGISGYQIAGSWHPEWSLRAGCADCRYSSVPYPRDGQPSTLLVGNVLYAAPSNSQHPELALEWLDLLVSDEIQSQIFPETGRLPTRRNILDDLKDTVDAPTAVFITELLENDNLRILPQWEENPREIWAIYNDLLEDVLLSTQPIPVAMADAQEAVEALSR